MAIAYDSSVDGGSTTGSSMTFAFNNVAGDYLFVGVVGDTALDDVTGVTYNGVSLTQVGSSIIAASRYSYLFSLASPATGSHNVVISAGSSHFLIGAAASWSGTNLGALDAHNSGVSSGAVSTYTTSITTVADNCWAVFISFGFNNDLSPPAAGTGLTRRAYDVGLGAWGFFDSGGVITPAGSFSGTTTRGFASYTEGHIMASIAPPGAASGGGPLMRGEFLRGGATAGRLVG